MRRGIRYWSLFTNNHGNLRVPPQLHPPPPKKYSLIFGIIKIPIEQVGKTGSSEIATLLHGRCTIHMPSTFQVIHINKQPGGDMTSSSPNPKRSKLNVCQGVVRRQVVRPPRSNPSIRHRFKSSGGIGSEKRDAGSGNCGVVAT